MMDTVALYIGYAIMVAGAAAVLLGALIGLALLGNATQHAIKDHFGGWTALAEFIEWRRNNPPVPPTSESKRE